MTITDPLVIQEDEFLTLPEIAFLGRDAEGNPLKRGTVESWRSRKDRPEANAFLEPDDYIGSTPVWRIDRVMAWLQASNRAYDVKAYRRHRKAGGFRRRADR
jgi:hypothetical protein